MKFDKEIAFNVLFWLLYFLYQWLGLASLYGDYHGYLINACLALPVAVVFSLLAVHVFFRQYYLKGRKLEFWLLFVLSSGCLILTRRYINYYLIYPRYFPFALKMPLYAAGKFLVDFVNLYVVCGLYALYYSVSYWYRERHRVQELLQQKTMAELELLKSQVQPHFIFNTLNNIYSAALKTSPETAALIDHLSEFLNYNLYDASKNFIALRQELDYIEHYIELQKNRYGSKAEVVINVFDHIDDLQVAPLLLLPLVENCFKHGVEVSINKSWVRIDVSRATGFFSVIIKNSHEGKGKPAGAGGIGLANVSKRLQLIYPDRHELKIDEGPDTYFVELKINLPK